MSYYTKRKEKGHASQTTARFAMQRVQKPCLEWANMAILWWVIVSDELLMLFYIKLSYHIDKGEIRHDEICLDWSEGDDKVILLNCHGQEGNQKWFLDKRYNDDFYVCPILFK